MIQQKRFPLASDARFHLRPPFLQPGHKALLAGLLVFLLLFTTYQVSVHWNLTGEQSMLDDLLGGLLASLVVYIYEKNRLKSLQQKLLTIELMNHHIRNALQPLMFLEFESNKEEHVRAIGDCVTRIEFALREVLPGHSTEAFAETETERAETARRHT